MQEARPRFLLLSSHAVVTSDLQRRSRFFDGCLSLVALGVVGASLSSAGCGGAAPEAAAPAPVAAAAPSPSGSAKAGAKGPKTMDPPGLLGMISGSYLLPELMPERGVFLR